MARMLRFPKPLRPGDRIGVTSPSAGVDGPAAARIDFCVDWLRAAGFDVVVGHLMDGTGITAGPAADRAAELTAMLCDPTIRCVIPPWGGETAIDLVDLLDWDALDAAEPTWLVGFSDLSTILVPAHDPAGLGHGARGQPRRHPLRGSRRTAELARRRRRDRTAPAAGLGRDRELAELRRPESHPVEADG